jgi:hypothetical protein
MFVSISKLLDCCECLIKCLALNNVLGPNCTALSDHHIHPLFKITAYTMRNCMLEFSFIWLLCI